MKHVWVKGLSGEDKAKRVKEIEGYRNAFDDLSKILEDNFKKKEANRDYSTPGWEYRQIAVNEWNAALDAIKNLIDLNQKD